jgi:hypothetical protein
MAEPDRKGGGGLSLRTLAIASAGSLCAAMATSRLFPPGTIYTAAVTPVIVAAVSEMLNRPVDRVSELRRQRRTVEMEPARVPTFRPDEPVTSGRDAPLPTFEGANGEAPGVRVYGSRSRILHPKVWIATGLVAFAIAAAALTLPELIFGGAIATKHTTTLFGGGSSSKSTTTQKTTTTPATTTTKTVTQTTTTPATTTPTQTSTTLTQTTPTTTTTTPTDTTTTPTGTSTSPTPSGVVPPAP